MPDLEVVTIALKKTDYGRGWSDGFDAGVESVRREASRATRDTPWVVTMLMSDPVLWRVESLILHRLVGEFRDEATARHIADVLNAKMDDGG